MFRKLISNLPYSPSLITEVGFYARRLKKEEATRRTAMIFVALTIVFQSFSLLTPPESANASSEQDIIRGGVGTLEDFLIRYDNNEDDLKDIYTAAGVVRSEIASAKPGVIKNKDNLYVMSRFGKLSSEENEISMSYPKSSGGTGVRYFSPLSDMSSSNVRLSGWVGESESLGWFGIIQSSGSLATRGIPLSIDPSNGEGARLTNTLALRNLTTQSSDTNLISNPDEKLAYTLRQTNTGTQATPSSFEVDLSDSMEYSVLFDKGGGTYDRKTHTLSWPQVDILPGKAEERTFILQVLSDIPSTGVGMSNPASYDCTMSVVFGNMVKTPLKCPISKGIESIFHTLPSAGMGLNIGFSITLVAAVLFFYIRNKQLKSEIRVVRHNFNTGII